MELRTYIDILWRRKWVIAITIIVATIMATVLTLLATPVYISSTTIRVATVGGGVAEVGRTDINYTVRLMNTYATIVTNGSVRGELAQQLGLDAPPKITVELIPDTELMMIRAEASAPEVAQEIAKATADILITQSREIYSGVGQTTLEILDRQLAQVEAELSEARSEYERLLSESPDDLAAIAAVNQSIALKERTYGTLLEQYEEIRVNEALRANAVSIVDSASIPRQPARPRHEVNIALGAVVGLIAGVGLAFVFENLDTTLYTTEQIEAITRLSPIGKIPAVSGQLQIIGVENGYQPQLEAFRRLRTNILASIEEELPQVSMITSAEKGEGKSTILANLAVTLSQSGLKVVALDCDMRLPTLHQIFDLPNKRGLTDILIENTPVEEAIQDSSFPRLKVVTSGPLPPNPAELLGSSQMSALLQQLKQEFDVVLLDTPALLVVADAAVLASMVDNVILIVARARSRREAVRAVRWQLDNVKPKSIGVVVNRAERNGGYYTAKLPSR